MDKMTEQRFIDLETRITHQEDIIQELNKVVVEQQRLIDRLSASNRRLVSRLRELADEFPASTPGDEKPPHY